MFQIIFVYALWTLQLVISAALLAKVLTSFQIEELDDGRGNKISLCDAFDKRDKDYQCSQLEGGVVSLLLVVLLILMSNYIN